METALWCVSLLLGFGMAIQVRPAMPTPLDDADHHGPVQKPRVMVANNLFS